MGVWKKEGKEREDGEKRRKQESQQEQESSSKTNFPLFFFARLPFFRYFTVEKRGVAGRKRNIIGGERKKNRKRKKNRQ